MRTEIDFSPLYRSIIGVERLLDRLEGAARVHALDSWPPYDIQKTGEDNYRISMAVAGFVEAELSLTQEGNLLLVSGAKAGNADGEYLHRGIAGRSFQRRFELADHVEVKSARLENGLLTIELSRELPEELKPRRIEIRNAPLPAPEMKQIERQAEQKAA